MVGDGVEHLRCILMLSDFEMCHSLDHSKKRPKAVLQPSGVYGEAFLHEYAFDLATGEWRHLKFAEATPELDLDGREEAAAVDLARLRAIRAGYFREARSLARSLEKAGEPSWVRDEPEIESLKNFRYAHRA